jgi:hypothetical protein
MRRWQLTALVVGVAALFFTARPAQAQWWIAPPAPVVVTPAPIVVTPAPVVVGPTWGARPYWGWGARRYAYYGPWRRAGWYGAVRGPRGGVVVGGRRW